MKVMKHDFDSSANANQASKVEISDNAVGVLK